MAEARTWRPIELVKTSAAYLEEKGVEGARLDAELLLAEVLGGTRIELYTQFDRPLVREEVDRYRELVRRRAEREPTSRILGRREFMGLPFEVTEAVFSPRPETEILVEEAVRLCRQTPGMAEARGENETDPAYSVLDLGTGSGCIAVSLAAQCPGVQVVATDLSPDALLVARRNAEAAGVWERIDFREGDLFRACWDEEVFDQILCNPPYIAEGDPELAPEARDYDPPLALYGGAKGLDYYPRIAVECESHLARGGVLLLELGAGQAEAVRGMLGEVGLFDEIRALHDHAGRERVLAARRRVVG